MKPTFFHLPEAKRARILDCAITEFADHGYEKGSLDRIVSRAGISKGGLYEYIDSKTDLFTYATNHVYDSLYSFIGEKLPGIGAPVSRDLIERVRAVSSVAIEFYLEHPPMIRLLARISTLEDQDLKTTLESSFQERFLTIFGEIDDSTLAFDKTRILELFKWLLVKTRNEFLRELEQSGDRELVRGRYIGNWEFYLNVLREGVYRIRA